VVFRPDRFQIPHIFLETNAYPDPDGNGAGLLGQLDKGGQFYVKQEQVARGFWEMTALHVQMRGKALFFKTIGVRQKIVRSGLHRVSDDLTLAQAADMLKK
jgi:hypothetical protein